MQTPTTSVLDAVLAGLAGSVAMTGCHETARRLIPQAPRLDSIGRRGLARVFRAANQAPPARDESQAIALAGDVIFNAGLFAAAMVVGPPRSAPVRGVAVGALVGLTTLILAPKLKIGPDPDHLATATKVMTVGLYAGGGLVSGLVYRRRFGAAGGS